jgi:hypothetical protein
MSEVNGETNVLEEIKTFTTFANPNNFDDYFALVLPTLSK